MCVRANFKVECVESQEIMKKKKKRLFTSAILLNCIIIIIAHFAASILWSTSSREELWATWNVPKRVFLFFFIFSACRGNISSGKSRLDAPWPTILENCIF